MRDIVERLRARAADADFADLMEDSVTKRRLLLNRQIDLDAIAEIDRLRANSKQAGPDEVEGQDNA